MCQISSCCGGKNWRNKSLPRTSTSSDHTFKQTKNDKNIFDAIQNQQQHPRGQQEITTTVMYSQTPSIIPILCGQSSLEARRVLASPLPPTHNFIPPTKLIRQQQTISTIHLHLGPYFYSSLLLTSPLSRRPAYGDSVLFTRTFQESLLLPSRQFYFSSKGSIIFIYSNIICST